MQRALALALTMLLVLAPVAAADKVNAPPGNSGVDQYLETIPDATGSAPTRGSHSRPAATGRTVLTKKQWRALGAEGPDGRAVARVAERYGIARSSRTEHQETAAGAAGAKSSRPSNDRRADSPLESLVRTIVPSGNAGGLGPLLPVILVVTAAVGLVTMIVRRRAL